MKQLFRISLFFIFPFFALAQQPQTKDSVRGSRYCEIIVVTGNLPKLTATVYNSFGCNDCPSELWKKLDANKIKKDWNAKMVILNGPRYLLMDKIIQEDSLPASVYFDSLETKQKAVVVITMAMALKGKVKPYQEQTAHRGGSLIFAKGSTVYELVSPEHSYIMQSFTSVKDSTLSMETLPLLQGKLKLPEGWSFKSVQLQDDLVMASSMDKDIFVTQDDLDNTYQRME
jgi:hypothetical protein